MIVVTKQPIRLSIKPLQFVEYANAKYFPVSILPTFSLPTEFHPTKVRIATFINQNLKKSHFENISQRPFKYLLFVHDLNVL